LGRILGYQASHNRHKIMYETNIKLQ